jgi:transcriptional regulator with XRE-family HTH domain
MDGKALRGVLAENIKRNRVIRGLSQERLAEAAKISPSFLSAIETGRKWPYPETLANLASALNVPVGSLFVQHGVSLDFVDETAKSAALALGKLSRLNQCLDNLIEKATKKNSPSRPYRPTEWSAVDPGGG